MSPPVAIAFSGRTRNFPKKTTEKTKKPKKSSKRNLKMLRKCRHSKSGHLIRPPSTPHVAPSHIDWKSKSDESQSRNRDRSHSRSRADERHRDQIRDLLSPDLTMIAPSLPGKLLSAKLCSDIILIGLLLLLLPLPMLNLAINRSASTRCQANDSFSLFLPTGTGSITGGPKSIKRQGG